MSDNSIDRHIDKIVKIAIPCFKDEVAPCFSATRLFRVWELGSDEKIRSRNLSIEEEGGLARIRILSKMNLNVLICNGVEERTLQLLEAQGCRVIKNVTGLADDALYGFLAGKISARPGDNDAPQIQQHTANLVEKTRELLTTLGWNVKAASEIEEYPIDLKAGIKCPECGKEVRIAVCCGAHAYLVSVEIQEFNLITAREFHARIYVHQATSEIVNLCRDFDIELLDPSTFNETSLKTTDKLQLPPLKGAVKKHKSLNIDQLENH